MQHNVPWPRTDKLAPYTMQHAASRAQNMLRSLVLLRPTQWLVSSRNSFRDPSTPLQPANVSRPQSFQSFTRLAPSPLPPQVHADLRRADVHGVPFGLPPRPPSALVPLVPTTAQCRCLLALVPWRPKTGQSTKSVQYLWMDVCARSVTILPHTTYLHAVSAPLHLRHWSWPCSRGLCAAVDTVQYAVGDPSCRVRRPPAGAGGGVPADRQRRCAGDAPPGRLPDRPVVPWAFRRARTQFRTQVIMLQPVKARWATARRGGSRCRGSHHGAWLRHVLGAAFGIAGVV